MRKNQPHRVRERREEALERTNKSISEHLKKDPLSERDFQRQENQRKMAVDLKRKLGK